MRCDNQAKEFHHVAPLLVCIYPSCCSCFFSGCIQSQVRSCCVLASRLFERFFALIGNHQMPCLSHVLRSRFRNSIDGTTARQIEGPTIGFQHLVTVTNTDSTVRRMLLSSLPKSSSTSNQSQLSSLILSDVALHPDAAVDETPVDRPKVDSPQSEMHSAMEVSDSAGFWFVFVVLTAFVGPVPCALTRSTCFACHSKPI